MASTSKPPSPTFGQPPRPPNAWILYRSDKIKLMPPIEIGGRRRAQGEVSKMISEMWKNEDDSIRLDYERKAERRKAEHARKYPGYRFQPMKKEEKEKKREEKKAEKERERATARRVRSAPYTPPKFQPVTPDIPTLPAFRAMSSYGTAGPSPPMSLANSPPRVDSPYAESRHKLTEEVASPSRASSRRTSPTTTLSTYDSTALSDTSHATLCLPNAASLSKQLTPPPTPGESHEVWRISHVDSPIAGTNEDPWPQYTRTLLSERSQIACHAGGPSPMPAIQDLAHFILPNDPSEWDLGDDGHFAQAMVAPTADPAIFQITSFDGGDLIIPPSGEIELELGNFDFSSIQARPQDYVDFPNTFAAEFGEHHSTFAHAISPPSPKGGSGSNSSSASYAEVSEIVPRLSHLLPRNLSYSSEAMLQYVNFDQSPQTLEQTVAQPQQIRTQEAGSPSSNHVMQKNSPKAATNAYSPPTGAALANNRRVGAMWGKAPNFKDDSPNDRPSSNQWIPAR